MRPFSWLFPKRRLDGLRDDLFLFLFVAAGGTGRRTGRLGAVDAREWKIIKKLFPKLHPQVAPCTHVLRFLLHPNHCGAGRVDTQRGTQSLVVQWIELFESKDRNVVAVGLFASLFQLVIHFSGAEQNAPHHFRAPVQVVSEQSLKSALRTIVQRRDGLRMPEQTFWAHNHQGLAPAPKDLAAQAVKILRWSGGIDDLDIVLCRQCQETLQARAGVFGTLP